MPAHDVIFTEVPELLLCLELEERLCQGLEVLLYLEQGLLPLFE